MRGSEVSSDFEALTRCGALAHHLRSLTTAASSGTAAASPTTAAFSLKGSALRPRRLPCP